MAIPKALIIAAGDFVHRFDWDWWCTLTFGGEPKPETAHNIFRKWLNKLNRRSFGNNYFKRPGEGLQWLRGTELQQRGVVHFHVLIGGWPKVHPEEAAKMWRALAGDCRIKIYDSTRGAAWYIVKEYAAEGNLDLGGVWPYIPDQLSRVGAKPTR